MFNIVLVEPEIPQNTGNIIRTAAATGCKVHLVKPLGFDISDRALKRAGLDYWHLTDFTVYESLDEFFAKISADGKNCWFASTKAARRYDDVPFEEGDYILFGKETKGLPEKLLFENYQNTIHTHDRGGALTQSQQFRGDNSLRGFAPARIRCIEGERTSDTVLRSLFFDVIVGITCDAFKTRFV